MHPLYAAVTLQSLCDVCLSVYMQLLGMSLMAKGVHSMRCINSCMSNVFHVYTSVFVVKL